MGNIFRGLLDHFQSTVGAFARSQGSEGCLRRPHGGGGVGWFRPLEGWKWGRKPTQSRLDQPRNGSTRQTEVLGSNLKTVTYRASCGRVMCIIIVEVFKRNPVLIR